MKIIISFRVTARQETGNEGWKSGMDPDMTMGDFTDELAGPDDSSFIPVRTSPAGFSVNRKTGMQCLSAGFLFPVHFLNSPEKRNERTGMRKSGFSFLTGWTQNNLLFSRPRNRWKQVWQVKRHGPQKASHKKREALESAPRLLSLCVLFLWGEVKDSWMGRTGRELKKQPLVWLPGRMMQLWWIRWIWLEIIRG